MKETHNYPVGDVNHSGSITISDVSTLIDYLLNDNVHPNCCIICADVKRDEKIGINDVSAMINLLLEQGN